MVEEQVVVLRARSEAEAVKKAGVGAAAYARGVHTNPYGQRVRMAFLGVVDVAELYASAATPGEAFWSTYIVPSTIPDRDLLKRLTPPVVPDEKHVRVKFLNKQFTWFHKDG